MSQQGSQRPADGSESDSGSQPESHNEAGRALTTPASDAFRTALQAWRAGVQGVSQIAADLQGELASLRRDLFFEGVPPAAASERLERAGARLAGHLERLRKGEAIAAQALRAVLSALSAARDELEKERTIAAARSGPSAATELVHEVRREISALSGRLAAPSSETLAELVEAVRDGLESVKTSLKGWPDGLARIDALLDGVHARVDAAVKQFERSEATAGEFRKLGERLEGGLAALLERLGALESALATNARDLRGELHRAVAELGERQRAVSERVERSGEVLQKGMDELLATVREDMETFRADLAKHAGELEAGLTRVDRLGDAVEDIGRRRGFRKLADAERAVLSEQTSLVERLEASGESLASSVRVAQQLIEEAVRAIARIAEANGQDVRDRGDS